MKLCIQLSPLKTIILLMAFCGSFGAFARDAAAADDFNYLVGRGIRDITGPAVGIQMFGFVREGQITEGIHIRQWARAFIVAEPGGANRIAFVSADMGSITNAIQREVVDRLRDKFGDTYHLGNVIVSATHTHSGPGGFWHYGADSPIGSPFYGEHFEALVDGIVGAIVAAHEDLQPGAVLINRGKLENAGVNRSAKAYLNNPAEERAKYDSDTNQEMTLLKFVDATGEIGSINWFAVHPTSMTYNNKLISGDHKGYASLAWEKMRKHRGEGSEPFVAAFAQSDCGDVTSNLNLDNTGPGKDEFETTKIIGERQLGKALELFAGATERLEGSIDFRQSYVDFSSLEVADRFTGAGPQRTCASAYGYSFAAGSTEDGGGHPLFREGMLQRVQMIDSMVASLFKLSPPSDHLRACHAPKVILFAPGEMKPDPGQAQVLPISLVRIGQLAVIAGPAEFTTMAGRRIRATVADELGDAAKHLVIAGYSNDYAGYVTTREEYETQQYEGGHTLYGPWELAGYQQEYARLAADMAAGRPSERGPEPRDLRGKVKSTPLSDAADPLPEGKTFGEIAAPPKDAYARGERVEATFWSGNPQHDFRTDNNYLSVERREANAWTPVATDTDWETKCWWRPEAKPQAQGEGANAPAPSAAARGPSAVQSAAGSAAEPPPPEPLQFTAVWEIPGDAAPGRYRIVHHGCARVEKGAEAKRFDAPSPEFDVRE